MMEGPFAEVTGYVAGGDKSPKPTIRVTTITHRKDPIFRGTIEELDARLVLRERHVLLDHARGDGVERARPRRHCANITDVWLPAGAGRRQYRGADQAELSRPGQASGERALWGSASAGPRALQSRSPSSTTTSTFTITPPSTGRSPIASMPATTTSSSCRRRSRPRSRSLDAQEARPQYRLSTAPASGTAC